MNPEHINQIVGIHTSCFPKNQSTKFGKAWLIAYYTGHIKSKNDVSFVYEEKKVKGFITGGLNMQSIAREVVWYSKYAFFRSILINIVKNPIKSINKFYSYTKAYIIPRKKTFYSDDTAALESIAVLPEYRGSKIAQQLMETFIKELKNRGVHACRLGVELNNSTARKFYEKMGFEQINEEGTSYIYFFDDSYRNKYRKMI